MTINEITIAVTTHGRLEYTKACIYSLIRNTNIPYKLILCSDVNDGTKEWASTIPEIYHCEYSIIPYSGAAQARNANIKIATEIGNEFCVLSDNDIIVPVGWDKYIFDILKKDDKIGFLMPLSLDMKWLNISGLSDKESVFLSLRLNLIKSSDYSNLINVLNSVYKEYGGFDLYAQKIVEENIHSSLQDYMTAFVFYVSRLSVLNKVGGFDENYIGAGWEDIDFAKRINLAGYRTAICPQSLIHHWMMTTRQFEPNSVQKEARNGEYFRRKFQV